VRCGQSESLQPRQLVCDEQDGFDFLRKSFDLLTTRVRGRKTGGTRTRRQRKRRRRGEHMGKE